MVQKYQFVFQSTLRDQAINGRTHGYSLAAAFKEHQGGGFVTGEGLFKAVKELGGKVFLEFFKSLPYLSKMYIFASG